jgi:hypothetical protein
MEYRYWSTSEETLPMSNATVIANNVGFKIPYYRLLRIFGPT